MVSQAFSCVLAQTSSCPRIPALKAMKQKRNWRKTRIAWPLNRLRMSAWMLKALLVHKTASILRLRTSYRRSRHLLEFLSVFGTISRRCFIASLFLNPTPNVKSNEKQIPLTKNKVSWSGISLRTYSPLQEHGTKIFYLICPGKRQRLSQTEWYMILCQAIS